MKYEAVIYVDGKYIVEVEADSEKEAREKINYECQEADFGSLRDICWETKYLSPITD